MDVTVESVTLKLTHTVLFSCGIPLEIMSPVILILSWYC